MLGSGSLLLQLSRIAAASEFIACVMTSSRYSNHFTGCLLRGSNPVRCKRSFLDSTYRPVQWVPGCFPGGAAEL